MAYILCWMACIYFEEKGLEKVGEDGKRWSEVLSDEASEKARFWRRQDSCSIV